VHYLNWIFLRTYIKQTQEGGRWGGREGGKERSYLHQNHVLTHHALCLRGRTSGMCAHLLRRYHPRPCPRKGRPRRPSLPPSLPPPLQPKFPLIPRVEGIGGRRLRRRESHRARVREGGREGGRAGGGFGVGEGEADVTGSLEGGRGGRGREGGRGGREEGELFGGAVGAGHHATGPTMMPSEEKGKRSRAQRTGSITTAAAAAAAVAAAAVAPNHPSHKKSTQCLPHPTPHPSTPTRRPH